MAKAGGTGVVGPFPERVGDEPEDREEYDRLRRRVLWAMPSGLYVVGSSDLQGTSNLMTLNWATQVAFDPKLVGIAVDQHALTHRLIEAGECFTVCFVAREDRAIVRRFTRPVEVDPSTGELNGFAVHVATTGAPVLSTAAAFLDCRVRQVVPTGDHTFFVGEVVDVGFLSDEGTEVLRMEDTRMNYGG